MVLPWFYNGFVMALQWLPLRHRDPHAIFHFVWGMVFEASLWFCGCFVCSCAAVCLDVQIFVVKECRTIGYPLKPYPPEGRPKKEEGVYGFSHVIGRAAPTQQGECSMADKPPFSGRRLRSARP